MAKKKGFSNVFQLSLFRFLESSSPALEKKTAHTAQMRLECREIVNRAGFGSLWRCISTPVQPSTSPVWFDSACKLETSRLSSIWGVLLPSSGQFLFLQPSSVQGQDWYWSYWFCLKSFCFYKLIIYIEINLLVQLAPICTQETLKIEFQRGRLGGTMADRQFVGPPRRAAQRLVPRHWTWNIPLFCQGPKCTWTTRKSLHLRVSLTPYPLSLGLQGEAGFPGYDGLPGVVGYPGNEGHQGSAGEKVAAW